MFGSDIYFISEVSGQSWNFASVMGWKKTFSLCSLIIISIVKYVDYSIVGLNILLTHLFL